MNINQDLLRPVLQNVTVLLLFVIGLELRLPRLGRIRGQRRRRGRRRGLRVRGLCMCLCLRWRNSHAEAGGGSGNGQSGRDWMRDSNENCQNPP